MIITNLTGGLGNQMFQYATGRRLAIKHKTQLKLHFTNALFCTQRSYELDCFNIKAEIATKEDLKKMGIISNRILNRIIYLFDQRLHLRFNRKIITERESVFDPKILSLPDNIYLQGYWQNEKYFKDVEDQIRQDFTFIKPVNKYSQQLANLISESNSVSIHVRRGDFLKYNSSQILGMDYYNHAINKIKRRIKKPVFFVFSDDIQWCKDHLQIKNKTIYIEKNPSYEDMRLMSLCKHNIIANSSFSSWGARLNKNKNKIVIGPN